MHTNQTHPNPEATRLKDKRRKSGFTLMEILLVMALLGGLVVLGFNQVGRMLDDGNADIARIFVNDTMKASLFRYRIDNGRYPNTEEGLNALLTAPSGASNWKGPYMDAVPKDPWGKEYQYISPGKKNPGSYDVYSHAGDGVESDDDIGNWQ